MRKFIAALDGYKLSSSTLAYAREFTKIADAHLVGLFLDDFIYRTYNVGKIYKTSGSPEKTIKELDEKDKQKRDAAVSKFQQSCAKADISFSVHRTKRFALQELKHESIFADLLIVNKKESFNRYEEKSPTYFMKDLLGDVQCPVLVTPGNYAPVKKIILLYDGSPSSVYAVRMFSYTFGSFGNLPVEVFTVKEPMGGNHLPEGKLMKEFVKRHFPEVIFRIAQGTPEKQILEYLQQNGENSIVVTGAYRRSEISRWFKASMADMLMKELELPIFIAHNK